jgi:hypothetical protein
MCLFYFLQSNASEEALTAEDVLPHIAVIGGPLDSVDYRIVIERTVVMKDINNFVDAVTLFITLFYVFNLQYNAKNTFEFLQKLVLQTNTKITAKKAITLLAKLT